MAIARVKILASKYYSPLKKKIPELLAEMDDSRTGSGKVQEGSKISHYVKNKGVFKERWAHIPRTQSVTVRGSHWLNLEYFEH